MQLDSRLSKSSSSLALRLRDVFAAGLDAGFGAGFR